MILRPFEIEDIKHNSAFNVLTDGHQQLLLNHLVGNSNIAYTLEHKGQIIGSGGIDIPWPGVAEGWALISELVHKYPVATTKAMKQVIPVLEKKYKLNRLQALCLEGFERAERWLERLGFEYEGRMRKYGPNGETFLRYVRIT